MLRGLLYTNKLLSFYCDKRITALTDADHVFKTSMNVTRFSPVHCYSASCTVCTYSLESHSESHQNLGTSICVICFICIYEWTWFSVLKCPACQLSRLMAVYIPISLQHPLWYNMLPHFWCRVWGWTEPTSQHRLINMKQDFQEFWFVNFS